MEQNDIENEPKFKFGKIRFFIILILILIGIGFCVNLNIIFYQTNWTQEAVNSWCHVSDFVDCDGVAGTEYSLSFGVPNSIWGTLLYLVMLMLLFVDRIQAKFKGTIFDVFKNPSSYIATLALLSFAISMILAYISINIIHKICALCVGTYAVDLLIALFAMKWGKYIIFSDIKNTVVDFIDGAKNHFILFIIVLTGFVGTVYYLNDSYVLSPKLKNEKERSENKIPAKDNAEMFENKFPAKGNVLGEENAKVNVIVYSDYNCPFCRILNNALHKIVHENKYSFRVEEVSFPLDSSCNHVGTLPGHEASCIASRYAIAAKKQGKFWGVANVLFDGHFTSEEAIIKGIKRAHLGLNIKKLEQDANSEEIKNELQNEIIKATKRAIGGTPAYEIDGVLYVGFNPAEEYEMLKERIRLAEKRARN